MKSKKKSTRTKRRRKLNRRKEHKALKGLSGRKTTDAN